MGLARGRSRARPRDACLLPTLPRHPERTITLSIGLTGASAKANLTPVNWLELADQNLYLAKRSGRNRVIMTEADPKLRLAAG